MYNEVQANFYYLLLSGLLWALFTHQIHSSLSRGEWRNGARAFLLWKETTTWTTFSVFTIKHFIIPLNSINFEHFNYHYASLALFFPRLSLDSQFAVCAPRGEGLSLRFLIYDSIKIRRSFSDAYQFRRTCPCNNFFGIPFIEKNIFIRWGLSAYEVIKKEIRGRRKWLMIS